MFPNFFINLLSKLQERSETVQKVAISACCGKAKVRFEFIVEIWLPVEI